MCLFTNNCTPPLQLFALSPPSRLSPTPPHIPIPSPMTPTKIAPAANMPESKPIPPEPHLISSEPKPISPESHSKVGFVARNSDCQAYNNDCKPRNHHFPPCNQNKHHLHPCRKGLSLCCMVGDGDDGNGCGAANGLCISFVLTNSSYLYNIVA